MSDFPRLHEIGYSLKCCALCIHSRFYDAKSPSWGICTRGTPEQPPRIHKLGRCRRGFKSDPTSVVPAGLSGFEEFIK